MSKISIICLTCGKVQIRTDMIENINGAYIHLKKPRMCPNCEMKTKHIATNKVQTLRTKLENQQNNSFEEHVLNLIKR